MNSFKYLIAFIGLFFSGISNGQETYTIDRLINELLESNYGIKILRNEVVIAHNNNNIGAAGYLPTITINADHYRSAYNTKQAFFSGAVNEVNGAKSNSTTASAMLNWTFFDGFKMFAIDKRLDLQEDVATMKLTAEMEMQIYQATVQFYTLLQFQELEKIYLESMELSNSRYEQQKLKEKLGSSSEVQLIQSRLDLYADSSVFLQNQNEIEKLRASLNYLIGKDQTNSFLAEGDLNDLEQLNLDDLRNSAIEQNTNILMNKASIAIREQERKEVLSNFYPQLNFYSQYAFARSESQVGVLNSNRSLGPGIGLSLSWNILNNLSTYTNLKNSKLYTENANLELENQKIFISSELQKSFDTYLWTVKNLELEQNNIDQAGFNFDIAKNAYENGSITDLELREFQFSVIQSKSRYLQAQLQQKTAELNIRLISGDFKRLIQ